MSVLLPQRCQCREGPSFAFAQQPGLAPCFFGLRPYRVGIDRQGHALRHGFAQIEGAAGIFDLVEIVFALPKNFEEGNVDSIQRVAFKQTEQDRGNPLIAVPAKITDDFHMVALNDDADARKVNLELMKTRSWIDIPITYRNGRRALITFEKGATGTAVFDKVMGEWAALGQQTSNNQ